MRLRSHAIALAAFPVLLAVAGLGFAQPRAEKTSGTGQPQPAGQTQSPQQIAEAAKNLETIQYSFREVAKRVLPVVVEIDVVEVVKQPAPQLQSPFDWFFNTPPEGGGKGGQREFRKNGLGSGIIVRRSGSRYDVLTNNHVVGDATQISVQLNDQRTFKAKLVGKDPRKDIALVSFESKDELPVAELGDSNDLQVGDIVLAVGNPFGFESTITMGIVSALGRRGPQSQDVAQYTDYIQTDAAINQGNSGGALVNIRGQVVGINTWIAAPTGGSIGLGFAIPINNATKDIEDFLATGRVEYGWLGVQITSIQNDATYAGFAKDLNVVGVNGAFVLNVYRGSPADKAGILPGDYITKVSGKAIKDSSQLTQVVGSLLAGRSYDFELIRFGEKQKLSVKIGVRDEKDDVAQFKNLWPGMTVVDISDEVRQQVDIPAGASGVVVGYLPDSDTPASIAGFRVGDVISEINGKPVKSMMDFYKALNDKSKKEVTFHLTRKGTEISIGLTR
jgi:serine protease Do